MRTQSFQAADVVTDMDGNVCIIHAVHLDPHPPQFSHCGGTSARYTVRLPEKGTTETRWDWQFTLARYYGVQPKTAPKFSLLNALKKFFSL